MSMFFQRRSLAAFLVLFVLAAARTTASAQILYDNGGPDVYGGGNGVGVYADTGNADNGFLYVMEGNTFTAPTTGTAFGINFAGIYYAGDAPGVPTSDTFVISLYSTIDGAPDTSVAPITSTLSGVTSTVAGPGNTRTIYEISGILNTPLTLNSGTMYFLGISDTSNPYNNFAVALTYNNTGASVNYAKRGDGSFDVYSDTPLSFALVVPEPATWAFLVAGLAVLLVVRRVRGPVAARQGL